MAKNETTYNKIRVQEIFQENFIPILYIIEHLTGIYMKVTYMCKLNRKLNNVLTETLKCEDMKV